MLHFFLLWNLINSYLTVTPREVMITGDINYYGNIYQKVGLNSYEVATQLNFTSGNITEWSNHWKYQGFITCNIRDYHYINRWDKWLCDGKLSVNETILTESSYELHSIECNEKCIIKIHSSHTTLSTFLNTTILFTLGIPLTMVLVVGIVRNVMFSFFIIIFFFLWKWCNPF